MTSVSLRLTVCELDGQVMRRAQEIYARVFATTRLQGYKTRIDKGCKRLADKMQKDDDRLTESSWLRRRASTISEKTDSLKTGDDKLMQNVMGRVQEVAIDDDHWTAKHQRMVEKQVAKQQKRKLNAVLEGELPACHASPAEIESATKVRLTNARQAWNAASKACDENKAKAFILHPCVCYVESVCRDQKLDQVIAQAGCTQWLDVAPEDPERIPTEASVFVVDNPMKPPAKALWCAKLLGKTLVTPKTVCTGYGVALAYGPAIKTMRRIWCTDAFIAKNTVAMAVLRQLCSKTGSRWKLLATEADFKCEYEKARKNHRPASVCVLSRSCEQVVVDGLSNPRVHDKDSFLATFCQPDLLKSQVGAAKR